MSNLAGVQFEKVRVRIDQQFLDLAEGLDEAYYGQKGPDKKYLAGTGWRDGASSNWMGYNKLSTPEDSKEQFDRLTGYIWNIYMLVFHEANKEEVEPFDRGEYSMSDARASIQGMKGRDIGLYNQLKAWASHPFNENGTD